MNAKVKEFIERKLNETGRDVTKLIEFLNTSDFYTAPASTKYHGCYEGGLAEHSVNVMDAMTTLNKTLHETYGMPLESETSIIIVALLHDVCKTNCYKKKQLWRKDANGKWEGYDGWERNPDFAMGHGGKSVYLIQKVFELTDKEAQAIFWHMGPYDLSPYNTSNEMGDAFSKNTLAYLLNAADMTATYILENDNITWE